jgi:LytS/YehU family sensor histidine kinase
LLLPLVENAFKHGAAEQLGQAHILIALAVQGATFSCFIRNSKNADGDTQAPSSAGIGLRNVRQRLELLYPQHHWLEVEARPDTFTVRLTLQLPNLAAAAPASAAPPRAQQRPAKAAAPRPVALPVHENAA